MVRVLRRLGQEEPKLERTYGGLGRKVPKIVRKEILYYMKSRLMALALAWAYETHGIARNPSERWMEARVASKSPEQDHKLSPRMRKQLTDQSRALDKAFFERLL